MRHLLGNIISVIYSFFKFSIIKVFYFRRFKFYPIERFSPDTIVGIGKNSKLKLGKKVRVHSGTKIFSTSGGEFEIGNNCRINYNCMFVCRHKIVIEDGVEFGPNVLIYDHDHDFRTFGGIKEGKFKCSPVKIGKNSWIGANTIILRGSTIGKNCVIAAGSIVSGNVPDGTVFIQKRESTLVKNN